MTTKLLKTTFTGLAFGALALSAQAGDKVQLEGAKLGHWTMDFDAATKLAAEKKVPLMLNFTGSDWCGWCKLMDKNVFAEAEAFSRRLASRSSWRRRHLVDTLLEGLRGVGGI